MLIHIKRIYEKAAASDGARILVDGLWPRGFSKEKAGVDFWAKAIAPSAELRKWYRHDHDKWQEFKKRYFAELNANPDALEEFCGHLQSDVVTFVFSSKETKLNNAAALKEYMECLH